MHAYAATTQIRAARLALSWFALLTLACVGLLLSSLLQLPPWNMFCIGIVSNIVVVTWMIFRLSQKSQPVCSLAQMADR